MKHKCQNEQMLTPSPSDCSLKPMSHEFTVVYNSSLVQIILQRLADETKSYAYFVFKAVRKQHTITRNEYPMGVLRFRCGVLMKRLINFSDDSLTSEQLHRKFSLTIQHLYGTAMNCMQRDTLSPVHQQNSSDEDQYRENGLTE